MNKKLLAWLLLVLAIIVFILLGIILFIQKNSSKTNAFDGKRALQDVERQVGFGPRIPGSDAHSKEINFVQDELNMAGWQVEVLNQEYNKKIAINILAKRGDNSKLLLATHYDSRLYADNDPAKSNQTLPVPGANDGASGVAVLLEIARKLPTDSIGTSLLFIDIEDNGNIPGWEWIMGSRAYTANMKGKIPEAVVLLDMIGDADLNIYLERNSNINLSNQIWGTAKTLGYEKTFIQEFRYQVLDDHIPFIEKGIPSVDIIDLDYPYWHSLQDTPDKVSAESLQKVGRTILKWIMKLKSCKTILDCP